MSCLRPPPLFDEGLKGKDNSWWFCESVLPGGVPPFARRLPGAVSTATRSHGLWIGRRRFVGMSERPFQGAMDDQIGIASDGRCEMGVFVEAEGKVAERVGSVARLLQRAKH